jgi:predicted phosphodiesterase
MYDVYVISDIHLESLNNYDISDFIKPPNNPESILILSGDICTIYMIDRLTTFLKEVCSMFKHVIYVPGNNEFYRVKGIPSKTYTNLCQELDACSIGLDNLHILNNSCVSIGDYVFCGSILWSNCTYDLPHYFRISGFTKEIYNRKNANDISFIKRFVEETRDMGNKRIVITHYPPSKMCLRNDPRFGDNDKYKCMYYNNLDDMFEEDLVWIYGHTHYNINKKVGNTMLVSNQYGKGTNIDETYLPSFRLDLEGYN